MKTNQVSGCGGAFHLFWSPWVLGQACLLERYIYIYFSLKSIYNKKKMGKIGEMSEALSGSSSLCVWAHVSPCWAHPVLVWPSVVSQPRLCSQARLCVVNSQLSSIFGGWNFDSFVPVVVNYGNLSWDCVSWGTLYWRQCPGQGRRKRKMLLGVEMALAMPPLSGLSVGAGEQKPAGFLGWRNAWLPVAGLWAWLRSCGANPAPVWMQSSVSPAETSAFWWLLSGGEDLKVHEVKPIPVS